MKNKKQLHFFTVGIHRDILYGVELVESEEVAKENYAKKYQTTTDKVWCRHSTPVETQRYIYSKIKN